MTSFIKDDQTNIDKYRVAVNIEEYHIISKSIFHIIIILKFRKISQLFPVKNICNNVKKNKHV